MGEEGSSNTPVEDRTRIIFDSIFGFIGIVLVVFALDALVIGSVKVALFNDIVKRIDPVLQGDEFKKQVALYRVACASGMIGGLLALPAAISAIVAVILARLKVPSIAQLITSISFLVSMALMTAAHIVTIAAGMGYYFRVGKNGSATFQLVTDSEMNSRASGWLILGFVQFLALFNFPIIAFAVLRLIYEFKNRKE